MEKKNNISANTQINLTLKMLLSLLGGMLILFFGFYSVVVAPKLSTHDKLIEENRKNQTEQYGEVTKQLIEMNNGIGTLNGTVEGLNNRFSDLRELRDDGENTSGGFSTN
jgi:hypothetical protein